MTVILPCIILACLSGADSTAAPGDSLYIPLDESMLDEVVVTATRTPKALKDVPVVTRLISAEDIKKADATNIQDLLTQEIPGLEFGFSMSQETSLSMGGFGGNAVLFLVDGERLAGETLDNIDYNRLSLGSIGRVEIVKGAASALYGANAVGGVVNLITAEHSAPWHLSLDSRYNSMGDEWRSGLGFSVNSHKVNSATSLQYVSSNTVHLTSPFDTESSIHDIYGGRTVSARERLTFRPHDNLRLIARGGYYYRESDRQTYNDHYNDYNAGLRAVWQSVLSGSLELSYSYDQYDKARFVSGVRTHDHDYSNRQHIAHALYSRYWGANTLTAGADYMHDYLTSYQFAGNTVHSQNTVDAFVQFDYNPVGWFNIVASLRDDYFSASRNNAMTARAALMFKTRPITVRASYSGGFRAPSLKEMYMTFDMAGMQMIYGNPDLKPERSHNLNLSVERSGTLGSRFFRGAYSLTLSGYYSYYDSRITTDDFPGDSIREPGAIYANEDGVKVCGLDATLRYRTSSGLGLSLGYNYLHVAHRAIDSQFSQPRPHSATWRLDYDHTFSRMYGLYVSLSGRFSAKASSRYDSDSAYQLWKFSLRQRVWRDVDINFTVDNIFGYRPHIYYWNSPPTTGRTFMLGVSLDVEKLLN